MFLVIVTHAQGLFVIIQAPCSWSLLLKACSWLSRPHVSGHCYSRLCGYLGPMALFLVIVTRGSVVIQAPCSWSLLVLLKALWLSRPHGRVPGHCYSRLVRGCPGPVRSRSAVCGAGESWHCVCDGNRGHGRPHLWLQSSSAASYLQ